MVRSCSGHRAAPVHFTMKPNSELSEEERKSRKSTKKAAKLALAEARAMMRERQRSGQVTRELLADKARVAMRRETKCFVNRLLEHPGFSSDPSTALRDGDILRQHMSANTDRLDMFSLRACWGYVRRKFASRACLVFDSLRVVREVDASLWRDLRRAQNVVSIGGGPGNDLFGVWLLHKHVHAQDSHEGGEPAPLPRCFTVLDYAASQWREPFGLVGEHLRREIAEEIDRREGQVVSPQVGEPRRPDPMRLQRSSSRASHPQRASHPHAYLSSGGASTRESHTPRLHMHTCMHTYMHMSPPPETRRFHMHTCMHVHVHTPKTPSPCACMHAHVHVHTPETPSPCACMHAHVHVHPPRDSRCPSPYACMHAHVHHVHHACMRACIHAYSA